MHPSYVPTICSPLMLVSRHSSVAIDRRRSNNMDVAEKERSRQAGRFVRSFQRPAAGRVQPDHCAVCGPNSLPGRPRLAALVIDESSSYNKAGYMILAVGRTGRRRGGGGGTKTLMGDGS